MCYAIKIIYLCTIQTNKRTYMSKQKKFILEENSIPTRWYNIQADMPTKPLPPLNPATKRPMTVEELVVFSLWSAADRNSIPSMRG